MNRRRRSSLAGSPLLIGALTTLIVVVAVFLSYNANNGLPFVPTYNLKIVLPETSGLQPTNQVRIAGTRVGVISSLTPQQNPTTGRVTAIADLKLEKSVEPLPADTKAIVLSVSAIGLKYLELEKGTSSADTEGGARRFPSPRRANRSTSTSCSTCSTRRRGPRFSTTRSTSATASPGAGWG